PGDGAPGGRARAHGAAAAARPARGHRGARQRSRHPREPALPHLRSVLHDQAARRGQRSRPVGLLRHRRPARRAAVRGEPSGGRRDVRRRAADGGAGLSARRAARRALLPTTLLIATGCAGVGGPVPGAPPHHRQHGFANTIAAFARPGFWTVQAFRARRVWASLAGTKVAPDFPRMANDGAALRHNRQTPTLTWIGHATLLVQLACARTPFDTNRRLWCGWALAGRERRLFFGGDTGYYDGFRDVGARLGPFDLALLSISAYEPPAIMRMTHTTPEEALHVFADIGARTFVAMHWGTFDLSDEPLDEPPRRLRTAARALRLPDERVWVLAHGETRTF